MLGIYPRETEDKWHKISTEWTPYESSRRRLRPITRWGGDEIVQWIGVWGYKGRK